MLTFSRENAKLPSFTRVPNPYREGTAEAQAEKEADEVDVSMQAGPSKHPALPKEAWTTLFAIHYKNYRKVNPASARFGHNNGPIEYCCCLNSQS